MLFLKIDSWKAELFGLQRNMSLFVEDLNWTKFHICLRSTVTSKQIEQGSPAMGIKDRLQIDLIQNFFHVFSGKRIFSFFKPVLRIVANLKPICAAFDDLDQEGKLINLVRHYARFIIDFWPKRELFMWDLGHPKDSPDNFHWWYNRRPNNFRSQESRTDQSGQTSGNSSSDNNRENLSDNQNGAKRTEEVDLTGQTTRQTRRHD